MRKSLLHTLLLTGLVLAVSLAPSIGAAVAFGAAPAAEAGGEAGGHAGEAPSAPLGFKADLAIWSLVTFAIFLLILKKFAWTPLISALDTREARFKKDLADAEAARIKSQQLLADHEQKLAQVQDEVREIIAEARRDAEHTKQEMIATAQRESEAMKQRAIGEIERSRDQALAQLFDHMSAAVATATEHVLGRALSDGDQDRLIREALENVSAR